MWPTPFVSVLSLPLDTTSYVLHENAVVVQTSNNDVSKGKSVVIWTGGMEIGAHCDRLHTCLQIVGQGRVWVRFWCGLIDKDFCSLRFSCPVVPLEV
jgi:hypothetical protein